VNKLSDNPSEIGQRRQLIEQLIEKGIENNEVLEAMLSVPRHLFMPIGSRNWAYIDKAQAIEEGQTISQPYTVAFQSSLLDAKPKMKVLEIGTGSGYQAAVLAQMGIHVFSVERHELLHKNAKNILQQLGYKIETLLGDGTLGWTEKAPFDRILVTATAPEIPMSLITQLKPNGMMVIPVKEGNHEIMKRITKAENGVLKIENHGHFKFVPLIGKEGF